MRSQLCTLLTPSGPSHGDRGTALHQLRNTGLPVWTDYKPGSEYTSWLFWGKNQKPFPAVYVRTTVWGQTMDPSTLGFVFSSNHRQMQDFQNLYTQRSVHRFTAMFLALLFRSSNTGSRCNFVTLCKGNTSHWAKTVGSIKASDKIHSQNPYSLAGTSLHSALQIHALEKVYDTNCRS